MASMTALMDLTKEIAKAVKHGPHATYRERISFVYTVHIYAIESVIVWIILTRPIIAVYFMIFII